MIAGLDVLQAVVGLPTTAYWILGNVCIPKTFSCQLSPRTSRNIKIVFFKQNIGLFPLLGYECLLYIQTILRKKEKNTAGRKKGHFFEFIFFLSVFWRTLNRTVQHCAKQCTVHHKENSAFTKENDTKAALFELSKLTDCLQSLAVMAVTIIGIEYKCK
jgi:hypothetical protein